MLEPFSFIKNITIFPRRKRWPQNEYFDESWKERLRVMAGLIQNEKSILDLGCGMQWLKEFIPDHIRYYPVDYKQRQPNVIVCNFNKKQFPKIKADIAFIAGCLEYMEDPAWFVKNTSMSCSTAICSYSSLENFPDMKSRTDLMWVNHLSRQEIIDLFYSCGMKLSSEGVFPLQEIFRFDKI